MNRTLIPLLLSLVLGACGGGGGGSSASSGSDTSQADADATLTAEQQAEYAASFPMGLAILPPELFAGSSASAPAGVLRTANTNFLASAAGYLQDFPGLSKSAAKRAMTDYFRPALMHNTAADAPCMVRDLDVHQHDDFPQLDTHGVADRQLQVRGMWRTTEPDGTPCAAAQVQRQMDGIGNVSAQALLLAAYAVHQAVANGRVDGRDISTQMQEAMNSANAGLTVTRTTVRQDRYHIGGGQPDVQASKIRIHAATSGPTTANTALYYIALSHITYFLEQRPDPERFFGNMQITASSYDSGRNAYQVCEDEVATVPASTTDATASRHYKVSRVQTIRYFRDGNEMSIGVRQGRYCGFGAEAVNGDHVPPAAMTEDPELDASVELPEGFLINRGVSRGWIGVFSRFGAKLDLSARTGTYYMAMPMAASPLVPGSVEKQSWMFAANVSRDTGDEQRLRYRAAFGVADGIAFPGEIRGMLCNDTYGSNIPRIADNRITLVDAFQSQEATLVPATGTWAVTSSRIRFAPTATCNASPTMSFDLDGSGDFTVGSGEGGGFMNELDTRGASSTIADELNRRGMSIPSYF